jgi:hypothetical protein
MYILLVKRKKLGTRNVNQGAAAVRYAAYDENKDGNFKSARLLNFLFCPIEVTCCCKATFSSQAQ